MNVYMIKADVVIHKSCSGNVGRAKYVYIHLCIRIYTYMHKYTHKDIHYIQKNNRGISIMIYTSSLPIFASSSSMWRDWREAETGLMADGGQ